jgi:hypothetical protein
MLGSAYSDVFLNAFEKQDNAHIMEREIYNELVARYGET